MKFHVSFLFYLFYKIKNFNTGNCKCNFFPLWHDNLWQGPDTLYRRPLQILMSNSAHRPCCSSSEMHCFLLVNSLWHVACQTHPFTRHRKLITCWNHCYLLSMRIAPSGHKVEVPRWINVNWFNIEVEVPLWFNVEPQPHACWANLTPCFASIWALDSFFYSRDVFSVRDIDWQEIHKSQMTI